MLHAITKTIIRNTAPIMAILLGIFSQQALANIQVAPVNIQAYDVYGESFTVVPKGNAHAQWFETQEGVAVVQESGEWFFADFDGEGFTASTQLVEADLISERTPVSQSEKAILSLRSAQRYASLSTSFHASEHEHVHMSAAQAGQTIRKIDVSTQVNQPIVAINVAFNDQPFEHTDFAEVMFGSEGSVRHFFEENSFGAFQITPAAETEGVENDGIISITLDSDHPNFGSGYGAANRALFRQALTAADEFINYQQYDADGDGYVTAAELGVVLIIAGYENAYGGSSALEPRVWAHQLTTSPSTHDGVGIGSYAMFGEMHGTSEYNKHRASIGIMCHELGHLLFGLPDLYDRDGSSQGVGNWGVMGDGSWNYVFSSDGDASLGNSPAHMLAWSKVEVGFVVPEEIEEATDMPLTVYASSTELASVKRIWVNRSESSEHFLVERRAKQGFDEGLYGEGILITHIDPAVTTQNDNDTRKLVAIEAADGSPYLGDGGDIFPGFSDAREFTPLTSPSSDDNLGNATGISITDISDEDVEPMTFSVSINTEDQVDASFQGAQYNYQTQTSSDSGSSGGGGSLDYILLLGLLCIFVFQYSLPKRRLKQALVVIKR